MVSLDVQHTGGMSFEDRLIHTNDEFVHENTPLIIQTEQEYRSIGTTFVIAIHLLFIICFEMITILLPYFCYDRANLSYICTHYSAYNILIYMHVGIFFLNILFDRLYQYHQDHSRRNGYFKFYRQTRNLRRLPMIFISIGNTILILLIKLLEEYQNRISPMQPWHCIVILTTIENLGIVISLTWYLILTVRFNRQCLRPDVIHEDDLPITILNEIGFRDESYKDKILEKQSDLIDYLRERNEQLTRLVHQSHSV